jgi:hypothetical protein
MRVGGQQATDPTIAEDMKNFSAQEAQHRRNHSIVNKIVRDKLSPETAAQVEEIEAELEADYREFTKDKSLQFNLAYAEGFEAMTLSTALARFDNPTAGYGRGVGATQEAMVFGLSSTLFQDAVALVQPGQD